MTCCDPINNTVYSVDEVRAIALANGRSYRLTRRFLASNRRCHYCGVLLFLKRKFRPKLTHITIDHLTPKSRGGKDTLANTVLCCVGCNREKGQMTEAEFMASRKAAV